MLILRYPEQIAQRWCPKNFYPKWWQGYAGVQECFNCAGFGSSMAGTAAMFYVLLGVPRNASQNDIAPWLGTYWQSSSGLFLLLGLFTSRVGHQDCDPSLFFMWGPKCLFQGTTASIRWLIIVYKIALSIKWYWQPHSGQWIIWHRMDGSSLVFLQRKFQREHTCTLSISINLQLYTVLRFVFGG